MASSWDRVDFDSSTWLLIVTMVVVCCHRPYFRDILGVDSLQDCCDLEDQMEELRSRLEPTTAKGGIGGDQWDNGKAQPQHEGAHGGLAMSVLGERDALLCKVKRLEGELEELRVLQVGCTGLVASLLQSACDVHRLGMMTA